MTAEDFLTPNLTENLVVNVLIQEQLAWSNWFSIRLDRSIYMGSKALKKIVQKTQVKPCLQQGIVKYPIIFDRIKSFHDGPHLDYSCCNSVLLTCRVLAACCR